MIVSQDLQNRVVATVKHCFKICFGSRADRFDITIVYSDDLGAIAGTAHFETSTITLNKKLLLKNVEEFLSVIVPHEAAHIIADIKFPEARSKMHGKEWKSIMRQLGCEPTRCHELDVSEIYGTTRFRYVCACDAKFHSITKIIHKKIESGEVRRCIRCDSRVIHFPVGDTY